MEKGEIKIKKEARKKEKKRKAKDLRKKILKNAYCPSTNKAEG